MLKALNILLAVWIASPGCLCPVLQALETGHHHHESLAGHATCCSLPPGACEGEPASCDHPEPDTLFLASESGAAGTPGWNLLLLNSDFAFHPISGAAEARISSRAPPPPNSAAAGRSARVTYCSFQV